MVPSRAASLQLLTPVMASPSPTARGQHHRLPPVQCNRIIAMATRAGDALSKQPPCNLTEHQQLHPSYKRIEMLTPEQLRGFTSQEEIRDGELYLHTLREFRRLILTLNKATATSVHPPNNFISRPRR
jgi:hypothetical protein